MRTTDFPPSLGKPLSNGNGDDCRLITAVNPGPDRVFLRARVTVPPRQSRRACARIRRLRISSSRPTPCAPARRHPTTTLDRQCHAGIPTREDRAELLQSNHVCSGGDGSTRSEYLRPVVATERWALERQQVARRLVGPLEAHPD